MIFELEKLAVIVLQVRLEDVTTESREDIIAKPADEYRHAAALDPYTHSFSTKHIVVCAKYFAIVKEFSVRVFDFNRKLRSKPFDVIRTWSEIKGLQLFQRGGFNLRSPAIELQLPVSLSVLVLSVLELHLEHLELDKCLAPLPLLAGVPLLHLPLYPGLLAALPRTLLLLHPKVMFEYRLRGCRGSLEVRRVQRLQEFPHAPRLLQNPPIEELHTLRVVRVLPLEMHEQTLREGQQRVEVVQIPVLQRRPSNPRLQVPLDTLGDQICQLIVQSLRDVLNCCFRVRLHLNSKLLFELLQLFEVAHEVFLEYHESLFTDVSEHSFNVDVGVLIQPELSGNQGLVACLCLLVCPLLLELADIRPCGLDHGHLPIVEGVVVGQCELHQHRPVEGVAVHLLWAGFGEYLVLELRHLLHELLPELAVGDQNQVLQVVHVC
jgi:hypothetical protein